MQGPIISVVKRWLIAFTLLCVSIIAGERLCHFLTDGFYEYRITSSFPPQEEWISSQSPPEGALTQPYHYLGCGAQSFVFSSEDNQFVLKFFKHHRWRKAEKACYRHHTLMSALYALKYLHDESLVEYVHLNCDTVDLPTVKCRDRLNKVHSFDLNKYQFIIQRKGVTLKERLLLKKAENNLEGAKKDLHQALNLLTHCHHKGTTNHDPNMPRNFGFVGDLPIVIDSGAFWNYQGETQQKLSYEELHKGTFQLIQWTKKEFPALTQEVEAWIEHYLND